MRTKLNWGLLSTARINQHLIPGLKESPICELAAVASRTPETARAYAAQWDIPKAYGCYEDLLADPQIDIIYNSLPNHLHAEWTVRACDAGKHVLCEKPLALTTAEVDAIAAAAERNNVLVTEAFMYRYHPQTEHVRQLVASGAIGDLIFMRGTFSFHNRREIDYRWLPEAGGGSLWDVGCYPVSYARMLAGDPPSEVFGWQEISASGVDAKFSGQLHFAGGLVTQFSSAFVAPYFTWFEIRGSEATVIVPHPFKSEPDAEVIVRWEGKEERTVFPAVDIYRGEVESLTEAVLTGGSPRLSLDESRDNVATLVALYESARTGVPVKMGM